MDERDLSKVSGSVSLRCKSTLELTRFRGPSTAWDCDLCMTSSFVEVPCGGRGLVTR